MYDWISVKERLPENEADAILTWDGDLLCASTYWDRFCKKWRTFDNENREFDTPSQVTHWFPFPSSPKKKDKIYELNTKELTGLEPEAS